MDFTRTVRAVQWKGANQEEVLALVGQAIFYDGHVIVARRSIEVEPDVHYPDGVIPPKPMRAALGQWIVEDNGLISVKDADTVKDQYGIEGSP